MKRDSKELAYRIDVMVAFQNKEDIEFREIRASEVRQAKWATSFGNLGFNWNKNEYRLKGAVPREGYVFNNHLHQHPSSHKHRVGEGTCFRVREVLDEDDK